MPILKITKATDEFTKIEGTFTYNKATDGGTKYFSVNGPIWSGQMRAFDQGKALNLLGFRW